MNKRWMVSLASCLLAVLCLLAVSGVSSALAAQSTKDITASAKLKQESLQKVGAQQVPNQSEYIIGHGDVLGVSVYGEGNMAAGDDGVDKKATSHDQGVTVRLDGRISLKHVGDVQAAGLTPTQLADMLKTLFATVYDDPVVTVVLQKSNSQWYTVMGKVAKPAVYPINYPINLVQAIAEAGGFDQWANSKVTVVRKATNELTKDFQGNTLKFDYDDFLAGKNLERNITIKADDIIIVH